MKNFLPLILLIGTTMHGTHAGDWGKTIAAKAPIEECIDLGGEVTVGYMSDYFHHGYHIASGSVFGDLNYTFDGLAIPITIGAWYLNGVDRPGGPGANFDTLQLYATARLGTFAGFEFELSYTHHSFPEGFNPFFNVGNPFGSSEGEVHLDFSRELGFATLKGTANYLLGEADLFGPGVELGFYGTLELERAFQLTDRIDLVLSGGVGYVEKYGNSIFVQRGFNHYYLMASLPIQLNCRTTLTPYIGYNDQTPASAGLNPVAFTGGNPIGSVVHGGIALSVTF